MTITAPAVEQKQINWKAVTFVLVALAVIVGGWAYAAKYAQCDFRSKFCVISIAGTRSEIGCEWDSWSCYVSTYPANEPTYVPPRGQPV